MKSIFIPKWCDWFATRRSEILQMSGIATQEYKDLQSKKYQVEELIAKHKQYNPLLITDLKRK